MRKGIIICISLLLTGFFMAHLIEKEFLTTYGLFTEFHLKYFANTKMDNNLLLWNILWGRLKLLAVVCVLLRIPKKVSIILLIKSLACFAFGLYMGICFVTMRGLGILISLVAIFPHGILYVLVFLLAKKEGVIYYNKKRERFLHYIGLVILILALLCTAVIFEVYIGTPVLKFLINKAIK